MFWIYGIIVSNSLFSNEEVDSVDGKRDINTATGGNVSLLQLHV